MSNLNANETIVALMWTIVISMGSGVLAWHWMKPASDAGILLFILVWGMITLAGYFISEAVVSKIADDEITQSSSDL